MLPLFLTKFLAGKIIQALCWMLIHSLWQGLLFTIVMGAVMMATTRSAAVKRYNLITALFFLFIAVCIFTFFRELNYSGHQVRLQQYENTDAINDSSLQYFFKKFIDYASSNAAFIVMLWFVIFCYKGVKMTMAFVYNKRVRDHRIVPSADWKNKINKLCKQLHIKKTVSLFESEIVKIPVVIGHLKPIIFIPVGLLTSLPAGEVEAVLLHELAHIRRNDYIVNMAQVIAETIFFFNPALLWMSHVLREERENCCDDVAVTHTKSKKQYIQALISFKEHALYTTQYTTAFPAGRNQLLKRVTRIVTNRNRTLDSAGKMFLLISFVSLTLLCVAATNLENNVTANKEIKKEIPPQKIMYEVNSFLDTRRITYNHKQEITTKKSASKKENVAANFKVNTQASFTKDKPASLEITAKTIIAGYHIAAASDAEQTNMFVSNKLTNEQQVELYRLQAEKDREQAVKDRKQAELDRLQADKDRLQADKDREQAEKDRKQAMLDRQQAEKDREQAEKDRQQAERERAYPTPRSSNTRT